MNIAAEKRYAVVTWIIVFIAAVLWALFAFGFNRVYFTNSLLAVHCFLGFTCIFGLARYYVTLKGCEFSRKKVLALALCVWIAVTGFMVMELCDTRLFSNLNGHHSALWYVFFVMAITSELAALVVSTEVGLVALTDHEKAKELELHGIRAIRRN
jgi:hypothetical protein